MASANFTHITEHLVNARVNWSAATFKAALVTAAPSAAQIDSWEYFDDITTEVTDADYTAGGYVMTASIGTLDTVNDRLPITYAASNPVAESAAITARGMIIYSEESTEGASPLLHFVDFGEEKETANGEWNLSVDTPFYINA